MEMPPPEHFSFGTVVMLERLKTKYMTSGLSALPVSPSFSLSTDQANEAIDRVLRKSVLKLNDLGQIQQLIQAADMQLSSRHTRALLAQLPEPDGPGYDRRSMWQGLVDTYSPAGLDWDEGHRHLRAQLLRLVLDHGPDTPEVPRAVMQRLCKLRGLLPAQKVSSRSLVRDLWCDTVMHEKADAGTWVPFMDELFGEHPDYQRGSGPYFGHSAQSAHGPVNDHPYHPYLLEAWGELYYRTDFVENQQVWRHLERLATEPEHDTLVKDMLTYNPLQILDDPHRGARGLKVLMQANPETALDLLEHESMRRDWMGPERVAPLLTHTNAEIRQRAMRLSARLEASPHPPAQPQEAGSVSPQPAREEPAGPSPRR